MRKYLFTAFLLAFGCLLALGLPRGARAASPQDLNGPFTLEDREKDTPAMLRYKAALRLFAGVWAVRNFCEVCSNEKAWTQYEKRNGTTIGYVVGQFKLGLGFGDEQKAAVKAYADEMAKNAFSGSSCSELIREVNGQGWDLYKGERFQEDYTLVRSKN